VLRARDLHFGPCVRRPEDRFEVAGGGGRDLLCFTGCAVIAFNKQSSIVGLMIILLNSLRSDNPRTCGASEEEEALACDNTEEHDV
jgi:hypothetical protein